ncbi:DUF1697 domain-containing protein [Pseudomonas sp. GOM7]|uniref:DUF1697 domain-containing protein n=1 Tax=Pseudomonas sp. GOM7 TaxID=2998079 RepID=UPI00227A3919|nr:DUF1697 domain-containing protein [Pseudomonas sp. GOM7]WAJ39285.1 DUF1697 domain-containing protein [Pseudomonas sp. GOM7]
MKYCAFLRGVNVRGTTMKMADVCQVFVDAGMEAVSSVLASGNIVFTSAEQAEASRRVLENAMAQRFAYKAFLFVKSRQEIESLRDGNPFVQKDELHVYAFVGNADIAQVLMQEFDAASKAEHEEAAIVNNVFYWQVPKGNTLDSAFGKILGRKSLKDRFTSRNINTFEKVLKKMGK